MEKPTLPKVATTPIQFFREVMSELKKVTWPSRQETIRLTAVVIAISLIVAFFIGGLDALFLNITTLLYRK